MGFVLQNVYRNAPLDKSPFTKKACQCLANLSHRRSIERVDSRRAPAQPPNLPSPSYPPPGRFDHEKGTLGKALRSTTSCFRTPPPPPPQKKNNKKQILPYKGNIGITILCFMCGFSSKTPEIQASPPPPPPPPAPPNPKPSTPRPSKAIISHTGPL